MRQTSCCNPFHGWVGRNARDTLGGSCPGLGKNWQLGTNYFLTSTNAPHPHHQPTYTTSRQRLNQRCAKKPSTKYSLQNSLSGQYAYLKCEKDYSIQLSCAVLRIAVCIGFAKNAVWFLAKTSSRPEAGKWKHCNGSKILRRRTFVKPPPWPRGMLLMQKKMQCINWVTAAIELHK